MLLSSAEPTIDPNKEYNVETHWKQMNEAEIGGETAYQARIKEFLEGADFH